MFNYFQIILKRTELKKEFVLEDIMVMPIMRSWARTSVRFMAYL